MGYRVSGSAAGVNEYKRIIAVMQYIRSTGVANDVSVELPMELRASTVNECAALTSHWVMLSSCHRSVAFRFSEVTTADADAR